MCFMLSKYHPHTILWSKYYLHTTTNIHLDHICIYGSFVRAERHPFWHTKILGPVSTHIMISATYTPRKDLMYTPQATSCISLLAGLHGERHFWHPCDAPPSAWMRQWPKLALWNPSLPLVQRSHDSPLLGLVRTLLKSSMLCTCRLCHLQQPLSDIPTCIELVSS